MTDAPPTLLTLGDLSPVVDPTAFVAPGAVVVGDVTIGGRTGVWYSTVVRGDTAPIRIGEQTNLQDGCVLHADPDAPLTVGDRVTVGHRVVLHGATIEDDVLIGMGSVVMNGARIGTGSLVAAGSLVTEGTEVPPGSLVMGSPAKVRRPVGDAETAAIAHGATSYAERAEQHRGARPVA